MSDYTQIFRAIALLLPLLGCGLGASAQKYKVVEEEVRIVMERDSFILPEMVLKFTPTSLYPAMNPALQFAFEHYVGESRSLQYELGGILPYGFGDRFDGRTRGGGFRLRAEYRKYPRERTRRGNIFIGGQYFFQEESRPVEGWVSRNGGEFEQYLSYRKNVMSHGALFVFGGNRVAKEGGRFHFEWAGAFGLRARMVSNLRLPDDAFIQTNNFLDYFEALVSTDGEEEDSIYLLPTVQFSFRFGGVLR